MSIFSKRLKELRAKTDTTQQQLADILGVGRPTIAGYETKGKQPDFEKLANLAAYFKVSTDYLIGIIDESTSYKENAVLKYRGIKPAYLELALKMQLANVDPAAVELIIESIRKLPTN